MSSKLNNFPAIWERTEKDVVIEEVLTDQIHCHIIFILFSLILNKIEQKKAPGNKDKHYQ